jgi:hypothetical protein
MKIYAILCISFFLAISAQAKIYTYQCEHIQSNQPSLVKVDTEQPGKKITFAQIKSNDSKRPDIELSLSYEFELQHSGFFLMDFSFGRISLVISNGPSSMTTLSAPGQSIRAQYLSGEKMSIPSPGGPLLTQEFYVICNLAQM